MTGAVLIYERSRPQIVEVARQGLPGPAGPGTRVINMLFDGGGGPIDLGTYGPVLIAAPGAITGWTLIADQAGSLTVDVRRASVGLFPAYASIVGVAPPTLSNQQRASGGVAGWVSALALDDVLEFTVQSVSTITRAVLALKLA
jgi:hypothetical protein